MNTQSYFKSKESYLNFRKAWRTRAQKRESLDFSMQLLYRFLRGKTLHQAISPRTKTDTLWMYSPAGICTLKEIMCWEEYQDWFNLEALEKDLMAIKQECAKGMPYGKQIVFWPESDRFKKLLKFESSTEETDVDPSIKTI